MPSHLLVRTINSEGGGGGEAESVFVGVKRSDVDEVEREGSMREELFVRERVLQRLKK